MGEAAIFRGEGRLREPLTRTTLFERNDRDETIVFHIKFSKF
jgi:hypothetical protein